MKENGEKFENYAYGVFLLKSKNSLFNADFSHEPRQLPDETFYATDKSLKYCIRKYIHDMSDQTVFFWRREIVKEKKGKKTIQPCDLGENYTVLFQNDEDKPSPESKMKVQKNLLDCWDIRIFGATFAEADCNLSITGPVQITYGINKIEGNQKYSSQILSPFRNSNEKKEEDKQRTLGNENRTLEAHYAFDFIINPKTLPDEAKLSSSDVALFKEALCKGVSHVNSCAKVGSESEFMLYMESKTNNTLPLLKDFVAVSTDAGKTVVDLKGLTEMLKSGYEMTKIEAYYEPACVEVRNAPAGAKKFNIFTQKPL